MRRVKSSEHEERSRPGMRRILDAMKVIREERSGLLDEASRVAGELAKDRSGGSRIPESYR